MIKIKYAPAVGAEFGTVGEELGKVGAEFGTVG